MELTEQQYADYMNRISVERWTAPLPPGPPKKRAIATIVHDEAFFFPIWLRYYSQFFAPEDIHVLDHNTTDGSTDRDGFVRIPVSHDSVDHHWMRDVLQAKQHELLETHDVVLVTDVDEIIAADPNVGDLGDVLDRFEEKFVHCTGRELLHDPDTEPAYDPSQPILSQRSQWFANTWYNKPAVATIPMHWIPGFHAVENGIEINRDPNIYLLHLHRMDYETCRARHALRKTRQWNEQDLADEYAVHNLLDEGERFDRWFAESNSVDDEPIEIEAIPERFANVI